MASMAMGNMVRTMIDLHAHILPGLDDGSHSWEDSLEMAAQAVDCGVEGIAATTHANLPGNARAEEKASYLRALEQFSWLLDSEDMELNLYPGMEIFAQGAYIERLQNRELLTINNTAYVLVEFPMDGPARDIYIGIDRLRRIGLYPVLAHPERYACVQEVPAHVREWREMDAVIQMNKGSILGSFGRGVQKTAHYLLTRRMVDVAASDAHSPWRRTTNLELLFQILAQNYGASCPRLLLYKNPEQIIRGKKIFRPSSGDL